MRLSVCCLLGLVLPGSIVLAQSINVPPRAQREILRRGDMVEHIVEGSTEDQQITQVLAAPEDDSDKWFFTLITTPNCQVCAQLKYDLANTAILKAYVNVGSHKESWMHFNQYDFADETQKWRWEKIKIGGFPTILVQPPRNGEYGDPKTVVLQLTGYNGNARQLAKNLRDGILRYVATLQKKSEAASDDGVGQTAPFVVPRPQPEPTIVPNIPAPLQPAPDQTLKDVDFTQLIGILLTRILGGQDTANAALILLGVIFGLRAFRMYRKAKGQQPFLSDEQFAKLVEQLEKVLQTKNGANKS